MAAARRLSMTPTNPERRTKLTLGDLAHVSREPADIVTSLYFWGQNRDDVNRLASGAAQGLDPRFAWVEVSDPTVEEASAASPERAITAPALDFVPPVGVSEQRIWTYIQPAGQRRDAQDLDSFTRMSKPIQDAIEHLLQRTGPRVLVVANLERLQELFCKDDVVPHPFIEWLNAHEITFVATSTGSPLYEGVFFDYSINQPDATPNVARPPIVAIRQRGDPDSSFLERIFHPLGVVSVAGPSSAARPAPTSSAPGSGA